MPGTYERTESTRKKKSLMSRLDLALTSPTQGVVLCQ